MMTQQQQQQQQIQMQQQQLQQQQLQQVQAMPALPVDASKVTVSGTGLHQANVAQETSFIVDGSQSGQSFITTTTKQEIVSFVCQSNVYCNNKETRNSFICMSI